MPFMSVQFFTEYPLWFILFCLAAGALYASLLYYRQQSVAFDSNQKIRTFILAVIRFLSVSIIAFLLLNPLLKYISSETRKPILVLAFDNSESIANSSDSAKYRKKLSGFLKTFQKQVGDEISVQPYLFGDQPKVRDYPDFKEKQSDVSALVEEISNVYSGSNLAGLVLISDGIYNKGTNPLYSVKNQKYPVYTVGLGDTTLKRDLKISNVRCNSIAYLNNTFPAVIDIQAFKCSGEAFKLKVFNKDKVIYESNIQSNATNFFTSVEVNLEADKPGIMHFSAELSRLKNEVTYLNNRKDFFIDVIDARQKILVVAKSPHPDLSALRQAIESNKNYKVELDLSGSPNSEKAKGYDLVILHQIPNSNQQMAAIEDLKRNKMPMLFILGRQTNLTLFNALKLGMSFTQTGGGYNQTTGIVNPGFNLFENPEEVKSNISSFPPFTVPFGNFTVRDKEQIMVFQQIGSVKTDQPLLCFNDEENNRYGFMTGEGFWRWRLTDFDRNNNHLVSNDIVCKSVQYLVARNDKRKFRVYAIENAFFENEAIILNAELYNQSYELVNKAEVKLTMTNETGKNYTFTFSRTSNAYRLDAGFLPPGTYNYIARVGQGGNNEVAKGIIIVKPLQLEFTETRANHQLLKQLATLTSGKFFAFDEIDEVAGFIKSQGMVKPVMYEQKDYKDLIHQKWVFVLILFLLTLEWFIRKRNGAY